MMTEAWSRRDLEQYMKLYGKQALLELLATTGQLYAVAVSEQVEDRPAGHLGSNWIVFIGRFWESLEKMNEYYAFLKETFEQCSAEHSAGHIGPVFLFKPDGTQDTRFLSNLQFHKDHTLITFEDQDKPGNAWRTAFAQEVAWNPWEKLCKYNYFPPFNIEKASFLLPNVISLAAHRREARNEETKETLIDYMRKHENAKAAIYYVPSVRDDTLHNTLYRPMRCVVSDYVADILDYLRTQKCETPIPLFIGNTAFSRKEYSLTLCDEYIVRDQYDELMILQYRSVPTEEHLQNMRKEYFIRLRYGQAEPYIVIPDSKKQPT